MAERTSRPRAPLHGVSAAIVARAGPAGITQRDLGAILGFASGSGINDRLHGRRSWKVDELGAIARELGCTVVDLYTEGERYPDPDEPPEPIRSSSVSEQPSEPLHV